MVKKELCKRYYFNTKLFFVVILMFSVLLFAGCGVNRDSSFNASSAIDNVNGSNNIAIGDVMDGKGNYSRDSNYINNDTYINHDTSAGGNTESGNTDDSAGNNPGNNLKTKIDFISIKNCTGNNESFSAEINDDDVIISHKIKYMCNALLNVKAETDGSTLKIYYDNVGELDRCKCVFDINLKVNVPYKVDSVEIYGFKYVDPVTDITVTSYGLLDQYPADASYENLTECRTDSDCVPDSCCHPRGCVLKPEKPTCDGVICTLECKGGTLDCGQGSCACVNGKCAVEWKNQIKI